MKVAQILNLKFYQRIAELFSEVEAEPMFFYSSLYFGSFEVVETAAETETNVLADYITAVYHDKWRRIIDAMEEQYNPLHNYDRDERYYTVRKKGTEKEVVTPTGGTSTSYTQSGDLVTTSDLDTAPYNAGLKQQSRTTTSVTAANGYETVTTNETIEGTKSETERTYNDTTANFIDDTLEGNDVEMHRNSTSGNIGVTTSQQMLESEIALRSKNIIINIIVRDCVNMVSTGFLEV